MSEKRKFTSIRVHKESACEYKSFKKDGEVYLQLDTLGSKDRKNRGKQSQTIRFNEESAKELKKIIEECFPNL